MKIKENEKKNEYLDLARELKRFWNMKVTVIPIISGVLGTVPIGFVRRKEEPKMGGRTETIQIVEFGKNTKKNSEDLLFLNLQLTLMSKTHKE